MIAQINPCTFLSTTSAAHSLLALPLREGRNRRRRFRGGVAEIDWVSPCRKGEDRVADSRAIGHHVAVRKAQDGETLGSQPRISGAVGEDCAVSKVLASVDLDNNLLLEANKVGDVAADGRLPAKAQTFQLASAKQSPKAVLRGCRATAHDLSELAISASDPLMRHSCFNAPTPPRNRCAVSALPQGEGSATNLHPVGFGRPTGAQS